MFCAISGIIFLYSFTIVQFSIIFPVSYETISLLIFVSPLAEDGNYLTIFSIPLYPSFFPSYFFPIFLLPPLSPSFSLFPTPLPSLILSPPSYLLLSLLPFPLSPFCPQFPRSLNSLYKLILVRSWQRNCSK